MWGVCVWGVWGCVCVCVCVGGGVCGCVCVCSKFFCYFCFIYYCYCVILHRFEQFWLRFEWLSSEGFKVYGTGGGDPSNPIIRLTYENWGDPEAFNNEPQYLKVAFRFLMIVNTGKWEHVLPNYAFGVICKFGTCLRELCWSTVVIYYERVFSLVLCTHN